MTDLDSFVAADVQQVPVLRGERGAVESAAKAVAQVERAVRAFVRREPFNRWRVPADIAQLHGWPNCARASCGIAVAAGVARIDWRGGAYHAECLYLELRALARTTENDQLAA